MKKLAKNWGEEDRSQSTNEHGGNIFTPQGMEW